MTRDNTKSPLPYRLRQPHSEHIDHAAAEHIERLENSVAELTQQRDAAEAELEACREKLAEIHQSWGMNLEH